MKISKFIILFAVSLILGGCGLYSNYSRPEIEFEVNSLFSSDSLAAPLNSIALHEIFTDPYLTSLIDSGLNANTDLRKAQLKIDEAAATLKASRLAFFPSVGISADGSVSNNSSNRFQIGPSASWELDIFGRQRNLKKGAEADFYATKAYRQWIETSLVASIAEGYYILVMLDEQLRISEQTLKNWEENIRTLEALKKVGRTNEAAIQQAKANRLKVESSAISMRKQIAAQENSIRSLIFNSGAIIKRSTFATQTLPDTLSAGVPADLLSNRPDVREAEYNLQRKFYDINVARAAFYPTLTLSGSDGWTTASGSVDAKSWISSGLASLAAPIFNRGTNQANLRIAKDEFEVASLDFQQTLLDAGLEVNNALTAWQTANGRLKIDEAQVESLRGAVKSTQLLMRHTNTNYLEVLTAQQRLLEAELTCVSDRYDAVEAVIALYHSLGGSNNGHVGNSER